MLKDIREKNKISQSTLAKLADISLRTLQDYEQGHKNINNAKAITLYKIAKILNCNIEDILVLDDVYTKIH